MYVTREHHPVRRQNQKEVLSLEASASSAQGLKGLALACLEGLEAVSWCGMENDLGRVGFSPAAP